MMDLKNHTERLYSSLKTKNQFVLKHWELHILLIFNGLFLFSEYNFDNKIMDRHVLQMEICCEKCYLTKLNPINKLMARKDFSDLSYHNQLQLMLHDLSTFMSPCSKYVNSFQIYLLFAFIY